MVMGMPSIRTSKTTPTKTALSRREAAPSGRAAIALTFGCVAAVLLAYVWYISVGSWTTWPESGTYFDQQARAFLHGQLALELPPDPQLLALENPYDPAQRGQMEFPRDMSLHNGRFYLYFGPVPALVLLVPRLFIGTEIGDQHLTFIFASGLFVVLSIMALKLWRRFFADRPLWSLGVGLLALGLSMPSLWLLSTPAVYSAAVLSAACFQVVGLYAAFHAVELEVERHLRARC